MPDVSDADRKAAADLYLDQLGDEDGFAEKIRTGTNLPGTNAWEEAFARHAAERTAEIVAWLRASAYYPICIGLATAIEERFPHAK